MLLLQDVSTMIRYGLNPIIFLINNGGYTIEVEIHDGPYNNIQGWDYSGLVQCFDNHQGNVFSTKARTRQLSFSVLLICWCLLQDLAAVSAVLVFAALVSAVLLARQGLCCWLLQHGHALQVQRKAVAKIFVCSLSGQHQ